MPLAEAAVLLALPDLGSVFIGYDSPEYLLPLPLSLLSSRVIRMNFPKFSQDDLGIADTYLLRKRQNISLVGLKAGLPVT